MMDLSLVTGDSVRYTWMHTPFSMDLDGEPWAVATDGRSMAAVRGARDIPASDEGAQMCRDLLALPPPAGDFDVAALLAWCGPAVTSQPCTTCGGTPPKKCAECEGTGSVECRCSTCDDEHEADCPRCNGKCGGCIDCDDTGRGGPPMRPRRLTPDSVFDANCLAIALLAVGADGGTGQWSIAGIGLVRLATPGWRVVAMPLSRTEPDATPPLLVHAPEVQR